MAIVRPRKLHRCLAGGTRRTSGMSTGSVGGPPPGRRITSGERCLASRMTLLAIPIMRVSARMNARGRATVQGDRPPVAHYYNWIDAGAGPEGGYRTSGGASGLAASWSLRTSTSLSNTPNPFAFPRLHEPIASNRVRARARRGRGYGAEKGRSSSSAAHRRQRWQSRSLWTWANWGGKRRGGGLRVTMDCSGTQGWFGVVVKRTPNILAAS
ncbi:hypothetical protein C8Q73DRAFT_470691 [Cubamyces lactineus]|nr:hypothetical protein C8Q73DRAFT_470691 [Cubamyces lactineus]